MAAERIALFDLDHTLIPFDSGMRWAQFLVAEGVLPDDCTAGYLSVCREYVGGRASIEALHRFAVQTLLPGSDAEIATLQQTFERHISAELPEATRALIAEHRRAGDACCIVTTTNHIVATPFARAFGVPHLLASIPLRAGEGYSGEFDGGLCHGQGKVVRVRSWLAAHAMAPSALQNAIFYSDSASDLPLLQAVGQAVAVTPDPCLRAIALARGWPIRDDIGRASGAG